MGLLRTAEVTARSSSVSAEFGITGAAAGSLERLAEMPPGRA